MKKTNGRATISLVKDVEATTNDYRDKVRFRYERFWGDPPEFCIPTAMD